MIRAAATRRDALRLAAIGAGALAVPALVRPAVASAQDDEADLEDFLERAIDLEQAAVLAYATAGEAKDADAELRRTLEAFRGQEQEHATALETALESIGIEPVDPPTEPAEVEEPRGLDGLERADEYLEFLVELERLQLEHYLAETPEFESEDLLRACAEIAACAAQHLVVLGEARGASPAEAAADAAG